MVLRQWDSSLSLTIPPTPHSQDLMRNGEPPSSTIQPIYPHAGHPSLGVAEAVALVAVAVPMAPPPSFLVTNAAKPGLTPCAKSWYQWPILSWMPKDEVLLAGVSGATVE